MPFESKNRYGLNKLDSLAVNIVDNNDSNPISGEINYLKAPGTRQMVARKLSGGSFMEEKSQNEEKISRRSRRKDKGRSARRRII